jgi:hypothetical protein
MIRPLRLCVLVAVLAGTLRTEANPARSLRLLQALTKSMIPLLAELRTPEASPSRRRMNLNAGPPQFGAMGDTYGTEEEADDMEMVAQTGLIAGTHAGFLATQMGRIAPLPPSTALSKAPAADAPWMEQVRYRIDALRTAEALHLGGVAMGIRAELDRLVVVGPSTSSEPIPAPLEAPTPAPFVAEDVA